MAHFESYGKCEIKKDGVTREAVVQLIKDGLIKYYNDGGITVTPTGVSVKGNLKSIWEWALTTASAKIEIDDNQLIYRVEGESSFGGWPWVWLFLGFFTGIFLTWFFCILAEYLICRDRPKRYFEEVFKSVQFEIG